MLNMVRVETVIKQETEEDNEFSNKIHNGKTIEIQKEIKVEPEEVITGAESDELQLFTIVPVEEYILPDQYEVNGKVKFFVDIHDDDLQCIPILDSNVNVEKCSSTIDDIGPSNNLSNQPLLQTNQIQSYKKFECFSCRRPFRNEPQLKRHLATCYRRFECSICNRRFKCQAYLESHNVLHLSGKKYVNKNDIQAPASNVKPFNCSIVGCMKTFSRKDRLKIHMRVHAGDKPYVCDETNCGKRFTEGSNLDKHKRTHTGDKRYICDVSGCVKRFATKRNLMEHQRIHTGDRPTCNIPGCGKSFSSKTTLRRHLRLHDGGTKFSQKHRLIQHATRIHNVEKPFVPQKAEYDAKFNIVEHTAIYTTSLGVADRVTKPKRSGSVVVECEHPHLPKNLRNQYSVGRPYFSASV